MIGDWIFSLFLLAIFAGIVYVGNVIYISKEDITPALRKTDSKMNEAYEDMKKAGNLALGDGIVGIVLVTLAIFLLVIQLFTTNFFDKISKKIKIPIKTIYGLIASFLGFYAGYLMSEAADAMRNSRAYKVPGGKKGLQSGIDSTILGMKALYGLSAALLVVFCGLMIYDISKKKKITQIQMIGSNTAPPGGNYLPAAPPLSTTGIPPAIE